jgi:hypothetical protein
MNKSITVFLVLLCACKNKPLEEKVPDKSSSDSKNVIVTFTDTVDFSFFNKTIIPDTITCEGFGFYKREPKYILENKKVRIKENDLKVYRGLILETNELTFWVCNPDKEAYKNIGDTIVVSAFAYGIGGSESAPGFPTLLKKILVHE